MDILGSINSTTSVSVGGSLTSTFETGADKDYIRVTLVAGRTYRIDLKAADLTNNSIFDPIIEGILTASGTSLNLSDDDGGRGLNAALIFTPPQTGTYFIIAGSARALDSGKYTVSVNQIPIPADDHGTDISSANSIGLYEETSGTIENTNDTDVFGIILNVGETYTITVTSEDQGKLGGLENPQIISFVDENGNAVPEDLYSIVESPFRIVTQISFTPNESGTYFITVGSENNEIGDYHVTASIEGNGVYDFAPVESNVTLTGNNNVDAFYEAATAWGNNTGTPATHITYSFPTLTSRFNDAKYAGNSEIRHDFAPFSFAEANYTRALLNTVSSFANVTFEEVQDSGLQAGTLRFARTDHALSAGPRLAFGYAFLPNEIAHSGDIWLQATMQAGKPLSQVSRTIIHELGHALGLSHPNREAIQIDNEFRDIAYSVMLSFEVSSTFPTAAYTDIGPQSFMWLDIQALIGLYGVSDTTKGNDSFTLNTASTSNFLTLWDTGGVDTVTLTGSFNVRFNLTPGTWSAVGTTVRYFNNSNTQVGTKTDTVFIAPDTTLENLISGSGSDRLTGNTVANKIFAGSGNDTIEGGAGNDTLRGDAGHDRVSGGAGNDQLYAGPTDLGNDTIDGGSGRDILGGGAGNDVVVGGRASASLTANNAGDAGSDTLFGGSGDDLLIGGAYNTQTATVIATGTSSNVIYAGAGNDTLHGDGGDDTLGGGSGGDNVFAGDGDDIIFGGSGTPDDNADTLNGGDGNDLIFASADKDHVSGNEGDDTLFGGAGMDTIDGGNGRDQIYGGSGNDSLTGGSGIDTFAFVSGFGSDTISDFNTSLSEADILDFTGIPDLTIDDIENAAVFMGGNATITLEGHGTLLLIGIDESAFQTILTGNQILI